MTLDSQTESLWQSLFQEDAPEGDKTCDSLALPNLERTAKIIAKQDLCLSGADSILKSLPKSLKLNVTPFFHDGDQVVAGQCLCLLEGLWKNLLLVERPLLNWIGHFSGIASLAHEFQSKVAHTKCKILDTRKTTPFYRSLEKKAVCDGGALNHRHNLSTGMMLKENHLSLYDFNIKKAVDDCVKAHPDLHLTVEASSSIHVEQILKTDANRIMLDNFTNLEISDALALIQSNNSKIEVEASGNMSLERVSSVAELGVDFISVGAITHSAKHADISMLMDF